MQFVSPVLLWCVGAVLGSFGNVLVLRLPAGTPLGGRSHCDGCGRTLTAIDLLPVFGGMVQRGKARCCGAAFGWSPALWELLVATLFLAAWLVMPALPEALTLGVCLWVLTLIARIDAATQQIPDVLNAMLVLAGGVLAVLHGEVPLAAVLVVLAVFGGQWVVSRGRWIGSGDIPLAVGIALMLRLVDRTVTAVLLAYMLGAGVAVVLLLTRRTTMHSAIAFGPFLCTAAIAVALVGDTALRALFG